MLLARKDALIARASIVVAALLTLGVMASPVEAQTSGVLIGVRRAIPFFSPDSLQYETLWIVRSARSPLRATLPELLVPRADGFWRTGVAATCVRDPDWRIDRVWHVPARTPPTIQEGCPWTTAPGQWRGDLDSAQAAAMDTVQTICAIERIEIGFITGANVEAEHYTAQTEECEPRGGRYDVSPLTRRWGGWDHDSTLELSQIAGAGADSAFTRAARAAARAAPEECRDFVGDTTTQDWTVGNVDHWYVARHRGKWTAFAYGHIYGTECTMEAPIALTLPRAFTGHDALRPSLAVIRRRVPKALDAISAPNGALVVAFTSDSLYAFESTGTKLGARLLAMPFAPQRIVMVQWAVGRNAARWDAEIARLRPVLKPARVIAEKR